MFVNIKEEKKVEYLELIHALFAASMIMFKTNMRLNIALSVAYVFAIFIALYVFSRKGSLNTKKQNRSRFSRIK